MNVFDFFKVPMSFNFIQTVDMYYKIHKVFNLEFNSKIQAVMALIDHFIFKFPQGAYSITPTIRTASIKLFPLLE